MLAYIKQNERKARKSVDTIRNNLNGDVSFNKFFEMFDILLYFSAQANAIPDKTYLIKRISFNSI